MDFIHFSLETKKGYFLRSIDNKIIDDFSVMNSNKNGNGKRGKGTARARKTRANKMKEQALINIMNASHVPRSAGLSGPYPQSDSVNCRFFNRITVSGAANFLVVDFRINSVWQPQVGGVTGTVSGYAGSAARYASYRVEWFKMSIRVVCAEAANAVSFAMVLNDTQPSTVITTYQQALTAFGSSASYFRNTVGQISGQPVYRSPQLSISPGSVVGNPLMYFSDRDFASPTGSNPNQAAWASFVALSDATGVNLTSGVILDVDIEYRTIFFGPLPLA